MLSVDKHFYRPKGREEESEAKREKFQVNVYIPVQALTRSGS